MEVPVRTLRGSIVFALVAASVGAAPAAPASPGERRPEVLRRVLDSLPPQVTAAAAQGAASNVAFASLAGGRHRGYRWVLQAYKASPSARTQVTVHFSRSAAKGTQRQTSEFGWRLPAGALSMGRKLKPSTLTTRAGMGNNGRISMRLASPTQYFEATPEGCTGAIEYRVGNFAGKLRVHARDLFFRRIALDRAQVLLYRERDLRCPGMTPVAPCPDDLSLNAADPEQGVAIGVFKTDEGRVDLQVAVAGQSGDADSLHRISVQVAVPEAFEASDDLTTASVDGDVAAPWLSGDLSYLAPPPATEAIDESCGPYRATSGVVTGDFTAHFDSIGDLTPAMTGMDATLRREAP